MTETEYQETRQRSFDEYLREQDAEIEQRQLQWLHETGQIVED